MLNPEETITLIKVMVDLAEEDADELQVRGNEVSAAYASGWADALIQLRKHIETDVKASCFPAGSCSCHIAKQASPC